MHRAHLACLAAALACLAGVGAFVPSSLLFQRQGLQGCTPTSGLTRLSAPGRVAARGRACLSIRAALDPGEEGFKDIEYRLKKLEKEAKNYKGTDQEDLAEGLKDDINETRAKLEKARKASKSRMIKSVAMAFAAAAAIGAAVFAFGPRKAYAATLTSKDQPASTAQTDNKPPKKEFQTAEGKNVVMELVQDDRVKLGAAFVVGFGASKIMGKGKKAGGSSAQVPFSSSSTAAKAPQAYKAPPAAAPSPTPAAAPKANPFDAKPVDAVNGKDPATMRASELKKAIVDMGGNTAGIMEKDELVALYKKLKAAPREMKTSPYNPNQPEDSIAADFKDFNPNAVDPAAVDEMMKNPMMRTLSNQMMNDPDAMRELQDAMSGGKGMGEVMKSAKFQEMAKNMMQDPEVSKMLQNPKEIQKMMDQMRKMGVKPPGM